VIDLKQVKLILVSRLGLAMMASLCFVAGAAAHALLVKSEPEEGAVLAQAPERVIAWFSQELDTSFSTLQVLDGAGSQVDNGDGGVDLYDPDHASLVVTLPPTLSEGRYTARWTVTSADDGDTTEGEFSFRIGKAGAAPSQTATAITVSADARNHWFVIWVTICLGILLAVVMKLAWGHPIKPHQ
jgi:copper transport protein